MGYNIGKKGNKQHEIDISNANRNAKGTQRNHIPPPMFGLGLGAQGLALGLQRFELGPQGFALGP